MSTAYDEELEVTSETKPKRVSSVVEKKTKKPQALKRRMTGRVQPRRSSYETSKSSTRQMRRSAFAFRLSSSFRPKMKMDIFLSDIDTYDHEAPRRKSDINGCDLETYISRATEGIRAPKSDPGPGKKSSPEDIKFMNNELSRNFNKNSLAERNTVITGKPTAFTIGFDYFYMSKEVLSEHTLKIITDFRFFSPVDGEGKKTTIFMKMRSLVSAIIGKYQSSPYHNAFHGFGVFHMAAIMLNLNRVIVNSVGPVRSLCFLVAALAHDIGHPGYSNNLECLFESELATKSKECRRGALEVWHVNTLSELMDQEQNDIFGMYSSKEQLNYRQFIAKMIISTDFTLCKKHQKTLSNVRCLQTYLQRDNLDVSTRKMRLLNALIHACDLSAQTVDMDVAVRWERRMATEMRHEAEYIQDQDREVKDFMKIYLENEDKSGLEFLWDKCPAYSDSEKKLYERFMSQKEAASQVHFVSTYVQPLWKSIAIFSRSMRQFQVSLGRNLKFYSYLKDGKDMDAKRLFDKTLKNHSNFLEKKIYDQYKEDNK